MFWREWARRFLGSVLPFTEKDPVRDVVDPLRGKAPVDDVINLSHLVRIQPRTRQQSARGSRFPAVALPDRRAKLVILRLLGFLLVLALENRGHVFLTGT